MNMKRLLSVLLALCLMFGCVPMAAGAEEVLENKEWPSTNIINKSGIYTIPENQTAQVNIAGGVTVTLIGSAAKTADNPYQGLYILVKGSGTTVTVQDLNVTSTGSPVIEFTGTGHKLNLAGESTFTGSSYCSAALVEVNGVGAYSTIVNELTIDGTGTLNLTQPSDSYAACIGGEAGHPCGELVIAGGTINAVSKGNGAAIGGGSGGDAPSITISGGTVYAEAQYAAMSYSGYNTSQVGAAIGSGNSINGGTVGIEITGGKVTAVSSTYSAAIGTSYTYGTAATATIRISGGEVNAYARNEGGTAFYGPAAIGTAYNGGTASITISGGEVVAVTETGGAAIGGGCYAAAATINVSGGTVSGFANSAYTDASYRGPALGEGCYGEDSKVYIDAGAVLAVGNASKNINATVTNSRGQALTEVVLTIPGIKSLSIGGVDWKVSANHADLTSEGGNDYTERVHIWLPDSSTPSDAAVETEDGVKNYELWNSGTMNEYHTVTYVLTDLAVDGPDRVYDPSAGSWNDDLTGTLRPLVEDATAGLPENISVSITGRGSVDFDYDPRTGEFTVSADQLTGDVIITASGVHVHVYDQQITDDDHKASDADCENAATYYYSCSCGDVSTTKTYPSGDPLGHDFGEYVDDNNATCTANGTKTAQCGRCGGTDVVEIPDSATGHNFADYVSNGDATCTEDGTKTAECANGCGTEDTQPDEGSATGHSFTDWMVSKPATCTEPGEEMRFCLCTATESREIPALGHNFKDGKCTRCSEEDPDSGDDNTPGDGDDNTPGGDDVPGDDKDEVIRLAGTDRFNTGIKVAGEMKATLGVEKFDTVIIASGMNFADALSGSYLATVKNAPILLTWNGDAKYNYLNDDVIEYIKNNLVEGGKVYILGGTAAVSETIDEALKDFDVERLAGENRFETNLLILEEAGIGSKDILVCTGLNFADSLSASATGNPILLVWNDLMDSQIGYLGENYNNNKFCIIGGESAVGKTIEDSLKEHGYTVSRLAGKNRFETSVLIAETYFDAPETAVLAYAWNYPDGLSGGALAYSMNAPLVLTMTNYEEAAVAYTTEVGITSGVVLGGDGLISDDVVRAVFAMDAADEIVVK